ncbi:MAG: hypothetical protein WA114_09590 [Psychrobacter glacincola]
MIKSTNLLNGSMFSGVLLTSTLLNNPPWTLPFMRRNEIMIAYQPK